MAGKNSTNVSGLVTGVAEIARANAATLTAAGVNIEVIVAAMEGKKDVALQKRGVQEQLMMDAEDATKQYDAACNETYNLASSACDTFAGAVGKTTPLGKRILAVRSDWRSQGQTRAAVTTPTVRSKKTQVLGNDTV